MTSPLQRISSYHAAFRSNERLDICQTIEVLWDHLVVVNLDMERFLDK
jgi:hypothetical protein